MKSIEESVDGTQYAIVYNNDGVFKARVFGRENRTKNEIKYNELNINELL